MALEHEYPLAPAELFAVVIDPAYLQARHGRFGGVGTPQVEPVDDVVVVRVRRQLPTDKIPGPVRPLVGDGIIEQEDTWNLPDHQGPVTASWRARLGGAPARLGGEHRIDALADGSRYQITVDVSVNLPLVGGRIEEEVSGYLSLLITNELAFLDNWIAENR